MGSSQRLPLQEELRKLERRLRRKWSGMHGHAPRGLKTYRANWLTSFQGQYQSRDRRSLWQKLPQGNPLLISDFHPLRRSARMLQTLLAEIQWPRTPCLVLEFLPEMDPIAAKQLLHDQPDLRLVDGRRLMDVYGGVIDELLRQDGSLAGVWTTGSPEERDLAAARKWQHWQQSHPQLFCIFHFGDWHLAEPHLPAALRDLGAAPTILHQSPEPLWDRVRPENGESFLQLAGGHFAWLHTPPMAQWTSVAQAEDQDFSAQTLESASDIIEEIAHALADGLEVPPPIGVPFVLGPNDWRDFQFSSPQEWGSAFHADFPPTRFLQHPDEPLFWIPEHPSWNLLVEMAAHLLLPTLPACANREQYAARTSFCHLLPLAWNPFLRRPSDQKIRLAYGTTPDLACRTSQREFFVSQTQLGMQAAQTMLEFPLLGPGNARELLISAQRAFIWYFALGTIEASAVSAS